MKITYKETLIDTLTKLNDTLNAKQYQLQPNWVIMHPAWYGTILYNMFANYTDIE